VSTDFGAFVISVEIQADGDLQPGNSGAGKSNHWVRLGLKAGDGAVRDWWKHRSFFPSVDWKVSLAAEQDSQGNGGQ